MSFESRVIDNIRNNGSAAMKRQMESDLNTLDQYFRGPQVDQDTIEAFKRGDKKAKKILQDAVTSFDNKYRDIPIDKYLKMYKPFISNNRIDSIIIITTFKWFETYEIILSQELNMPDRSV